MSCVCVCGCGVKKGYEWRVTQGLWGSDGGHKGPPRQRFTLHHSRGLGAPHTCLMESGSNYSTSRRGWMTCRDHRQHSTGTSGEEHKGCGGVEHREVTGGRK